MHMERVSRMELKMWRLAVLFMLLTLTRSSLIMEGNNVGSSCDDDRIYTILSIDGGGAKGIIPATILKNLEDELKKIDEEYEGIAYYFDLIAGTSTGGIISAFLTTPNLTTHKPRYTTSDMKMFYLNNCTKLFVLDTKYDPTEEVFRCLIEPKYNATYHKELIKLFFGGIRMKDTITPVVITSYDTLLLNPVIFTTSKAQTDKSMDVLLSDVVIGSSSPPLAYPPYNFNICTSDPLDCCKEFNLYDGAVVANNPTLVAVAEMVNKIESMGCSINFTRFRILSLGTGTSQKVGFPSKGYKWGKINYYNLSYMMDGSAPSLANLISATANDKMVESYSHLLLKGSNTIDPQDSSVAIDDQSTCSSPLNYLRLQIDDLASSDDDATASKTGSVERLLGKAKSLLDQNLTTFDPNTSRFIPVPNGCKTSVALQRFAKEIYRIKKEKVLSSAKLWNEI